MYFYEYQGRILYIELGRAESVIIEKPIRAMTFYMVITTYKLMATCRTAFLVRNSRFSAKRCHFLQDFTL